MDKKDASKHNWPGVKIYRVKLRQENVIEDMSVGRKKKKLKPEVLEWLEIYANEKHSVHGVGNHIKFNFVDKGTAALFKLLWTQ